MTNDQALASGARSVEAQEHAVSGLTQPQDPADTAREPVDALGSDPATTELGEITLTLLQQGQSVQVRAGSPFNSAELYEGVYESAEEANYELQQAGILQAPKILVIVAGGLKLSGLTAEQLQRAGLKRHHTTGL